MQVSPDEVQQTYRHRFDQRAKEAKYGIWKVIVEEFLQKWVNPNDTVLDIGCGYGEFLNHIRCTRRLGIDLNPDSGTHLQKEIEFHQGDACELSFLDDSSIDVVFTSNLIEHLPSKRDIEQMIREVRRILKTGG
ncbi:MAG: class I SAM-dependent methyltransferase, partial [bacterium]